MDTVTLYLSNSSTWNYELTDETESYINMQDQDGTSLKLNKSENKLYLYDGYNKEWRYMENTSKMINKVKINQQDGN